jgi:DNA-binding GntR family transcriptional regulator
VARLCLTGKLWRVTELDYDSEMPPSYQIAAILRERIQDGTYAPGSRMPSLTDLQGTYGVARNTARRAILILRDEGLVTLRAGWGTFVKRSNDLGEG